MIPSFLPRRLLRSPPGAPYLRSEAPARRGSEPMRKHVAVSLFTFVDLFSKDLATLEHVLNKGAEFAAGQGVTADQMLEWRLVEDMHPLRFQANIVINFSKQWTARAAGLPVPESIADNLDMAGLKAEIANARAFLGGLTAEQFAGRDDVTMKVTLGNGFEPELSAAQWLTGFATTNIYFHMSMAYAILRARGAPVGKVDLFAGGL